MVVLLILLMTSNSDARRRKKVRRHYNPKATKEQAMNMIRTHSEAVSELVGIEPQLSDSIINAAVTGDEGEVLTAEEAGEEISGDTDTTETVSPMFFMEEGDHGEDIEELEKYDDVEVDIDNFRGLWSSYLMEEGEEQVTAMGIANKAIMDEIVDWFGTPYRFGGSTSKGIDCSAFTQTVFFNAAKIELPRTARTQIDAGKKIKRKDLQFGDLIFFHTYSRRFASHVGIYLGDNLFAHASSRYGVTVSSLESTYYKKRFIGGRRLDAKDFEKYQLADEDKKIKH